MVNELINTGRMMSNPISQLVILFSPRVEGGFFSFMAVGRAACSAAFLRFFFFDMASEVQMVNIVRLKFREMQSKGSPDVKTSATVVNV